MKTLILLISFAVSTTYAQSPEFLCKYIDTIALTEQNRFTPLHLAGSYSVASQNFNVTYYRCDWQVDPSVHYITGKVTCKYFLSEPADTISFDLSNFLVVDSVIHHGKLILFKQGPGQLTLNFKSTQSPGSADSVIIYYQGMPASSGVGSFVNAIHDGSPILWTLSEPYGSRDWWPCKDGLSDKADSVDIYITSPSQFTGVSNGLLVSSSTSNGNSTFHWKHRYPIATYLVCMAVTNYSTFTNVVQAAGNQVFMQTFCYPESLSLFQQNTPLVLNSMQYFAGIFGNYPFEKEKYGHVQFGWGGGQEHQTSTFLVSPNENLMSHELAHQWFGDMITCASWEDIWLNEGFATHLASMDMEQKYPLTATNNRKAVIEQITSEPGGSVWVDDTTSVARIFNGRLSYRKGSHVLYMLRWILGDHIFFRGVNSYLNDPALRYKFATTADLQRNLEKESGKDLSNFFNDWIYGQGYPSYQVAWSQQSFNSVNIILNQATSHPSVDFFALPVALKFKSGTQEKTIVVNNTINGEAFTADIGFLADTVIIDPDYWLISRDNSSQKLNATNTDHFVQIFPNPVKDMLSIYLSNFPEQQANVKVFDMKGAAVFAKTITINGFAFTSLALNKLPPGYYVLRLQAGNSFKYSSKILKL